MPSDRLEPLAIFSLMVQVFFINVVVYILHLPTRLPWDRAVEYCAVVKLNEIPCFPSTTEPVIAFWMAVRIVGQNVPFMNWH